MENHLYELVATHGIPALMTLALIGYFYIIVLYTTPKHSVLRKIFNASTVFCLIMLVGLVLMDIQ